MYQSSITNALDMFPSMEGVNRSISDENLNKFP